MKSLKIVADERFVMSLAYIKKRLSTVKGVICDETNDETNASDCRTLECNFTGKREAESALTIIKDALAEIIVTDAKSHFIRQNIKLPTHDEVGITAFLCALCEFDRTTDKVIVAGLINLTPEFVIGSFYDFCLDILKQRWLEVCILANDNLPLLMCRQTFSELLRFLVSNIDSSAGEVFLRRVPKSRTDQIQICDRDMKQIECVYVNESLSNEQKIMASLVALNPRRIFFCDEPCELYKRVEEIFSGCVSTNQAGKPQEVKSFLLY